MAAVPVLQNGLVHGSRVDIILTTQNMVSVGEYNPLPYDELVDGKFLFQVDKVVMKSNRQIHVIRTFTPQQDCMALSVSKGPGQEKIFEMFASGNQCEDSEREDSDSDEEDGISEILLRFHPDFCSLLYEVFDMDPAVRCFEVKSNTMLGPDYSGLELFFCNDGTSADGMASISSRAKGRYCFKRAVDQFLDVIYYILYPDLA